MMRLLVHIKVNGDIEDALEMVKTIKSAVGDRATIVTVKVTTCPHSIVENEA